MLLQESLEIDSYNQPGSSKLLFVDKDNDAAISAESLAVSEAEYLQKLHCDLQYKSDRKLYTKQSASSSARSSTCTNSFDENALTATTSVNESDEEIISLINSGINCTQPNLSVIISHEDIDNVKPLLTTNLSIEGNVISGEKFAIESLLFRLDEHNIEFSIDYSGYNNDIMKNPGLVVFIKNFSSDLICPDYSQQENKPIIITDKDNEFFKFLNENSYFKSLSEIKLFVRVNSAPFCLIKFNNHLDVDFLIKNLPFQTNKFNHNEKIPLYANKYINKPYNGGNFVCDTLILTNLLQFFPSNISIEQFEHFINVFAKFSPIENIYFPIHNDTFSIGYIKFKKVPNITEIGLKILLAFNGITWTQFLKCQLDELDDLIKTNENATEETHPHSLQLNIAQQKHNHYLLKYANSPYIGMPFTVFYPNPWLQVNFFAKSTNYQETNIYVINVAQLFHDNDSLWSKFWCQFGDITSAKIINREGCKNLNDSNRQIGFVFYKEFKLAIKAILNTNNKLISIPDKSSLLIQSSFALQKQTYQSQGIKFYQNGFVPPMPLLMLVNYQKDIPLNEIFSDMDMWLNYLEPA